MAHRVVLDVDTGTDDALALLLAALHPHLDLAGVVCTAGNVGVDLVVRNTLHVLDVAGRRDVPVVRGAAGTLDGRGPRAGSRHGADGLAGLAPASVAAEADPRTPARLLRDVLPGARLVLLAPQSSLAAALRVDPAATDRALEVVAAAGSRSGAAGFNASHDAVARAEVAAALRRSGTPHREVPVEHARAARLEPPARTSTPAARLAARLLAVRDGSLGDAAVLATLLPGDPAEVFARAVFAPA